MAASLLSGFVKKLTTSTSVLVPGYHQEEDQPISHSYYKIIAARSNAKPPISASIFTATNESKRMGNFAKAIKSLKHPVILKIHDSHQKQETLSMAVERVSPIEHSLDNLTDSDLIVGFWRILRCLEFLHENAKLLHGSIGESSVFVTESGEFKLGGFDYSISYTSPLTGYLDEISFHEPLIHREIECFERKCPAFACIDGELLGQFMQRLCRKHHFKDADLKNEFENATKKLLSESKKVLQFSSFLSWYLMSCKHHAKVISIASFFEEYFVKTNEEKDLFLTEFIDSKMNALSPAFLTNRLFADLSTSIQGCISRTEFVSSEVFLFCQIACILKAVQFEKLALPTITRLFSVPDRGIRMILCKFLGKLSELIPKSILNDSLYPLLASGFNDSHPLVRKESLLAVIEIAPKLKSKVLNGDFSKQLTRLQGDSNVEVRTFIATSFERLVYLFEGEGGKSLALTVYCRALQDQANECRMAAINGILSTKNIYSAEDYANKFIPLISPLLVIHTDRSLREAAFHLFDQMLLSIRASVKSIQQEELPNLPEPQGTSIKISESSNTTTTAKQKLKLKDTCNKKLQTQSDGWEF